MKMKKNIKSKWVKALLSREYKQTWKGYMHIKDNKNVERFCVLGVLCDILDNNVWKDNCQYGENLVYTHKGCCGIPSHEILSEAGLTHEDAEKLADMNDERKTFKTLANWIEKNL